MNVSFNVQRLTQRVKEKEKKRNMFQTKNQDKTPEIDLNKTEIGDLPD